MSAYYCGKTYVNSIDTYYDEIREVTRKLTSEEVIELCKRMESGDNSAKEILILNNLRLVIKIAKKYASIYRNDSGMSLQDLIQEGNLGLISAIERFDYRKGIKLGTYAYYSITSAITSAIALKSKTINLTYRMNSKYESYKKGRTRLIEELGRIPTLEEINERISTPVTEKEVRIFESINTISLNEIVAKKDSEKKVEFGSTIPSEELTPEEIVIRDEEALEVIKKLAQSKLSKREVQILILRKIERKTLEVLSKKYGVTRTRIMQIEQNATKKVKPKLLSIDNEYVMKYKAKIKLQNSK